MKIVARFGLRRPAGGTTRLRCLIVTRLPNHVALHKTDAGALIKPCLGHQYYRY